MTHYLLHRVGWSHMAPSNIITQKLLLCLLTENENLEDDCCLDRVWNNAFANVMTGARFMCE